MEDMTQEHSNPHKERPVLSRSLAVINSLIIGGFFAALAALLVLGGPHISPAISVGLGSPIFGVAVGLAFWTILTLAAEASPVEMPRGIKIAPTLIPCLAATFLGGPLAGAFVAFVGSTEKRELTGEVVWYGVLVNHASIALSAMLAGAIYTYILSPLAGGVLLLDFAAVFTAGFLGATANAAMAALIVSRRLNRSFLGVIGGDLADTYIAFCALVPFAWLFMFLFVHAGLWADLMAALPLYTIRTANQRFVEMRETFIQAIRALASALDARDIYTAGHSHRMSEVAMDIAREMHLSDDELEQIEWAGILHDVGKIGVPDRVLLKQGRLDDEERAIIEGHPVIGALIVEPVTRLSPEVPLIRHHHERWDGRGYPDGLAGEAIPLLARVLAVADSFDAMTAQRPYRMNPLTAQEAYAEIVKCSGSQFDPAIVEVFGRTKWARGEYDLERGKADPRFSDVSMVSGSARLINGINDHAANGPRQRAAVVEFVDPHGDEARRAAGAAAALLAQGIAAAEVAERHRSDEPRPTKRMEA